MALTINDTTYAGTQASYFILPATFSMDTVQKGVVHIEDGIKKTKTISRIDFQKPLQRRQATPVSSGGFTVDGRTLTPQDEMLYTEFDPRDFESHWEAEKLSPTLLARELPPNVENYMTQMALNRTFEVIESMIWMGSTTYTAIIGDAGNGQLKFFDGFIKKMVADAAVLKVANPFALSALASDSATVYNIKAAMEALISLAVVNKKALIAAANRFTRMKFLMSVASEQIYRDWLATLSFKGIDPTQAGTLKYAGYDIVPLAGFPDNTILFCSATDGTDSNLWLGMNSVSDENLQLARLQANSELFFIKGLMKHDVNYGWSEETFLFATLTSGTFTA